MPRVRSYTPAALRARALRAERTSADCMRLARAWKRSTSCSPDLVAERVSTYVTLARSYAFSARRYRADAKRIARSARVLGVRVPLNRV